MKDFKQLKENIQNKLNNLYDEHKFLFKQFNIVFENTIKNYTDKNIKVSINESGSKEFYFTIEFINNNERVFGAEIEGHFWNGIYSGDKDSDKEYKLYFNVGCCGEFSSDKNEYQCHKYLLLAELIKNASEIEKELQNNVYNTLHNLKVKIMKLRSEMSKLEYEEYAIKYNEIEKILKVGDIIYHNTNLTITKITKEYIYLYNGFKQKRQIKTQFIDGIIKGYYIVKENK